MRRPACCNRDLPMLRLILITTVLIFAGCVQQDVPVSRPTAQVSPSATLSASPTPTPTAEKIDTALQAELAEVVKAANGRVGVGAVLIETGDAAYLDRTGQYPMQSVYKLPIAMAVLKMMDEGKVRIDQDVNITPDDFVRQGFHSPIRNANPQGTVLPLAEVLRFSISESDGTASDVLLDLAGGPQAVMSYLNGIGVSGLMVADSEKSISKDWETQFRNWSTPEASIKLLRLLLERRAGLSEPTTGLLLRIMTETETGDRRLKRGLPEGATIAHKTGTGGTEGGVTGATNDIGIVTLPDGRHILLAVYVSNSTGSGPVREKAIADVARTVIGKWSPGSYPEKQPGVNGADFSTRHTLQ